MRKFETKEQLVEWIETSHLQNVNGRENKDELFRLGIKAAIEELTKLNLLSIPFVNKTSIIDANEVIIVEPRMVKQGWGSLF